MSDNITPEPPAWVTELRSTATVSVPRAAALLGISRAYAYEMAKDGRLPVVNLGPQRVRVISAGLLAMLQADAPDAA